MIAKRDRGFPHSARPRFVVPGEALKPPGLQWHCPRPPGDSAQACSLLSTLLRRRSVSLLLPRGLLPFPLPPPPPSPPPPSAPPRSGFARFIPRRAASPALHPLQIFLPALLISFVSRASVFPAFFVLLLPAVHRTSAAVVRPIRRRNPRLLLVSQAWANFTLFTRRYPLLYIPSGN